jgi:hypothetical protein
MAKGSCLCPWDGRRTRAALHDKPAQRRLSQVDVFAVIGRDAEAWNWPMAFGVWPPRIIGGEAGAAPALSCPLGLTLTLFSTICWHLTMTKPSSDYCLERIPLRFRNIFFKFLLISIDRILVGPSIIVRLRGYVFSRLAGDKE